MNETRKTDDYTRLAPDVHGAWVEDFVLEQRLIGVPGEQIGDALAVVQSHVAESGEGALEAFGDPKAYAREAAPGVRVEEHPDGGWLLGIGLGLVGMVLTTVGAGAWWSDDPALEVTVGLVAALLLTVAGFAVVVARTEAVLRLAVERPWVAGAVVVLWTGVVAAVVLLLRAPLLQVPAAIAVGAGVVLLGIGTALEWRTRAAGGLDDPIVGPGETAQGSGDRFTLLTVFLFPVLTVLMVGLTWVLSLLG